MKIEILGSGCDKCRRLAENADRAVRDAGVEAEVEKGADLGRIVGYGVLLTPAG